MYWSLHYFTLSFQESRQGFAVIIATLPGSLLLLTMQAIRKWIPFPVQKTRIVLKGGLTIGKFMEGMEQQEDTGFDAMHMLLQGLSASACAGFLHDLDEKEKNSFTPSELMQYKHAVEYRYISVRTGTYKYIQVHTSTAC